MPKKKSHSSQQYSNARDIGKVMQFETRLFKTLENGVTCNVSDSPGNSHEKYNTNKSTLLNIHTGNSKLRAGFETGYLGNSRHVSTPLFENDSDSENASSLRRKRSSLLHRSNSLSTLSPVPEEQENAFLRPHFVTEQTTVKEDDIRDRPPSRKLKFFDVRNLRLSFRRKSAKEPDTKSRFNTPKLFQRGQTETNLVTRPTSASYQNNCYFENNNGNCISCMRLLKDTRFCECHPSEKTSGNITQISSRKNSARYISSQFPLMGEQNQKLEKSIEIYGTVKRREKKKPVDITTDIRNSLARFSVTSNFVEDIPSLNGDKQSVAGGGSNPTRPQESSISLVKTLKINSIENKWICDIIVTKRNDYLITDLKRVYIIDRDGKLKFTVGTKGFNRLQAPNSVTTDDLGNLIVSDQSTQKIQIFGLKGQHLSTLEDSTFSDISRISCNDKNEILVTSTDKKRISVFSQSNQHLYSITSSFETGGSSDSRWFYQPFSITVNCLTGDIIVGDDYKQSVFAMSKFGEPKWSFTPPGERNRKFFPNSICTDNNGYIFVADLYNEKIYMLDSSGKYLKTLLSRQNGLKGGPVAIATDASGHLLVADEERTLKVFKYGDKGFALFRRFSYCPQNL